MNSYSFQQVFQQNLSWLFFLTLNTNRKSIGSSKKRYQGFSGHQGTSSLFERSACFYVTISGNFETFQYFNFEADFLENQNVFQKTGVENNKIFLLKALKLKTHHFYTKLPYQKPRLRQIEWWVRNRPVTKNGISRVSTYFFKSFILV